MKKLVILAALFLAGVSATAAAAARGITVSIGGTVKNGAGAAIGGATVSLGGGAAASAVTGPDGAYRFDGLANGKTYTITPSKAGLAFTPASRSVTAGAKDVAGQDFTGAAVAPRYEISGYTRDVSGRVIAGALVTLSGGVTVSTTTASDGYYRFKGIPGGAGYTLSAAKEGWQFVPSPIRITSLEGSMLGENFTGTVVVPSYAVGGAVTGADGGGIEGVTVVLSGGVVRSETTGPDGSFLFEGVPGGELYNLTATKEGWRFTPQGRTLGTLGSDLAGEDFTGNRVVSVLALSSISGTVRDGAGGGASGVTVSLSGGAAATAVTGADGAYRFDGLPQGKDYTVTPVKQGWRFSSAAVANLGGEGAVRDLSGVRTWPLRGRAADVRGAGIVDALVTLSCGGTPAATTVTGAGGFFEFPCLDEGKAYAVRVEKKGYHFGPPERLVPFLTGAVDLPGFIGIPGKGIADPGEVKVIGSPAGRGTINPDRGETAVISFRGTACGRYELRIFSLTGALVDERAMEGVSEGRFEWRAQGMASGVYAVSLRGPGIDARGKVAVLR